MVRAHSIHGTRAIEFTNAIFIQFETVFWRKKKDFLAEYWTYYRFQPINQLGLQEILTYSSLFELSFEFLTNLTVQESQKMEFDLGRFRSNYFQE